MTRLAVSRLALTLALSAACGEAADPPTRLAPTAPRAALVLEPPRVGIGDVAIVELAIVTPPDHAARPYEPPAAVPGFWLLEAETLPVEKQASRWIHRTRVRIRARSVGSFLWPASNASVEGPEGEVAVVPVEELALEVVSVFPEYPDRVTPFGARDLPASAGTGGSWGSAGAGAAAALAAVGLIALVRRGLRRRGERRVSTAPPPVPPWIRARADLSRARISGDPLTAAHGVAIALCRYMDGRFRADAIARTTEELDAATPPFAATSRWPAFLAVLRGLDEFRFRPPGDDADGSAVAERVEALASRAEAFVEDTIPPESRS